MTFVFVTEPTPETNMTNTDKFASFFAGCVSHRVGPCTHTDIHTYHFTLLIPVSGYAPVPLVTRRLHKPLLKRRDGPKRLPIGNILPPR